HYCRFASAAKQVLVTEFGTLYRGALPPLLQRASNLGIMFGCYAIARQHLDNSRLLPTVAKDAAVARAVMAASVAGACEAALMPFERIQTLLQMGNGRHSTVSSAYGHRRATNLYRDTFHAFCELRKRYGVPELYRGLSAVSLALSSK
uniref:Mitochondrial carrier protein n=1 Tax=Macrostomum lignano TaxID=282301 RepID=A0A1I8IZJ7_9PLAT